MPEENIINQETSSAEPSAGGSAEDELLSSSEASKLIGVSARTLKRRADLGILRRTSVHTQFGVETRYYKRELEKLRQEARQNRAGVVAEVTAELKGRRAEGADPLVAGGDTRLRSAADLAEVSRVIDQKIDKIVEPFFKLSDTLEAGFDKLLGFQKRIIEIETNRDQEKQQEKEEVKKRTKEERFKTRVIIISYIIVTFGVLAIFGYLFWLMYSGRLFGW